MLYQKYIHNIILAVVILFALSCTKIPTEIYLSANLKEGDSIGVSYSLKSNEQYIPVGGCLVDKRMAEEGGITIPITNKIVEEIIAFSISIYVTEDQTIEITSISAKDVATISADKLLGTIWWQDNTTFMLNSTSTYIFGHAYKDKPVTFANSIRAYYFNRQQKYVQIFTFAFIIFTIGLLLYFLRNNKQQTFLALTFAIYVMCLPLKISWGNWMLIPLSIATLYPFIRNKFQNFNFSPVFCGMLWIFLVHLIGITYAVNPVGKIPAILIGIILSFLFCTITLKKEVVDSTLRFVVRFIALYCMFILVCYIFALYALQINSMSDVISQSKVLYSFLFPFPSFKHPSFISIIISMTIPFAIHLKVAKKISWVELVLSIMPIFIVVLLSGARIGLAVVPLVLALGFLFYLKIPQYIKYIVVGIVCIVTFTLFNRPFTSEKFNDLIRQNLRTTAIAAIKERPLFGWGTDSMETLLHSEDIAQKAGLEKPIAEYNHFHNQYLDMLVQFGFISSIPFFALFIYLIYLAIKKKDFLLMAYLAIYLPFMWVESPFATAKGIQPMIFWLCFLVSTQKVRLNNETVVPYPENSKHVDGIS